MSRPRQNRTVQGSAMASLMSRESKLRTNAPVKARIIPRLYPVLSRDLCLFMARDYSSLQVLFLIGVFSGGLASKKCSPETALKSRGIFWFARFKRTSSKRMNVLLPSRQEVIRTAPEQSTQLNRRRNGFHSLGRGSCVIRGLVLLGVN